MAFAIIRARKHKSLASLSRSAKHAHRERVTPNAVPELTELNRTVGAKGSAEIVEAAARLLPGNRRKDAVVAIEYLVTASPEAFKRKGGQLNDMGSGYFNDALNWLRKRHGFENVISATVHLDESTPHLVAYVVPKTQDGRLSCRDFLGGPAKLRELQTDFHEACGAIRGLDRGLCGSKVMHEEVARFYSRILESQQLPRLTKRDYAAAAVGIKTKAWKRAEHIATANAAGAANYKREKKTILSRVGTMKILRSDLEERGVALAHQKLALDHLESQLHLRLEAIQKREMEARKDETRVLALEGERDALARRLSAQGAPIRSRQEFHAASSKLDTEFTPG